MNKSKDHYSVQEARNCVLEVQVAEVQFTPPQHILAWPPALVDTSVITAPTVMLILSKITVYSPTINTSRPVLIQLQFCLSLSKWLSRLHGSLPELLKD